MKSVRLHGRAREGQRPVESRGGTRENEAKVRRRGWAKGREGWPSGCTCRWRQKRDFLFGAAQPRGSLLLFQSSHFSELLRRLLRLRFPFFSPFTRRAQATRKTARTPLICPLLGHYLYANEKPVKRRDIGLPPPQDGYRDEVETLIRPVALTGDVTHRATVITRTAGVYANSQFYGVTGRKESKNGSGFVITFPIERSMGDRLDVGCLCKFAFFWTQLNEMEWKLVTHAKY